VIETLRAEGSDAFGPDPLFGWWHADGVRGAFLQTGAFPLLVSDMPEDAVESLADVLADRELAGVVGGTPTARAFAARWERLTKVVVSVRMRQRLSPAAHASPDRATGTSYTSGSRPSKTRPAASGRTAPG
jgi:hypothetical protein